MKERECFTCKKHYTQGGKCSLEHDNCLLYENEPRGKMIRTKITFNIDADSPETPIIKYGEKILCEENGKTIEFTCIKINWLNLETRKCSIDADYHENEKPKFEKMKSFKVIK